MLQYLLWKFVAKQNLLHICCNTIDIFGNSGSIHRNVCLVTISPMRNTQEIDTHVHTTLRSPHTSTRELSSPGGHPTHTCHYNSQYCFREHSAHLLTTHKSQTACPSNIHFHSKLQVFFKAKGHIYGFP